MYLTFKYTDGTYSSWMICANTQLTLTTQTIVSEQGKTVSGIIATYGSTDNTRIYDISLTEGAKIPEGWSEADEDVEVGGENLIGEPNPYNMPALSTGYNWKCIVGNQGNPQPVNKELLENGRTYVFSVEKVTNSGSSSASKFTIALYNGSSTVVKKLLVSSRKQSCTFNVPDTGNWSLIIYAGEHGYCQNVSLTFYNMMLQKGTRATDYQKYYKYLAEAFENMARAGSTEIDGGLLSTSLIKLRYKNSQNQYVENAGMSGLDDKGKAVSGSTLIDNANSQGVTLWGGASYAQALAAAAGNGTIPVLLTKTGFNSIIGCFKVVDQNTIKVDNSGMTVYITTNSISQMGDIGSLKHGEVDETYTSSHSDYVVSVPLNASGFYSIKNFHASVHLTSGAGSLAQAAADVQIKLGNTVLKDKKNQTASASLLWAKSNKQTTSIDLADIEGTSSSAQNLVIRIYNIDIVAEAYLTFSFEYSAGNESDFRCCVIAKDGLMIGSGHNRRFFVQPSKSDNQLHLTCDLPTYSSSLKTGELYVDSAGLVRQKFDDDELEWKTYKIGAAGSTDTGILDLTNFRTLMLPTFVIAENMPQSASIAGTGRVLYQDGSSSDNRTIKITKS